jgi:hypothetical protein
MKLLVLSVLSVVSCIFLVILVDSEPMTPTKNDTRAEFGPPGTKQANCVDKNNCKTMCANSFSRPCDQETCRLACNGNHGGSMTTCLDPPKCETFVVNGPGDHKTNCVCLDPGHCQFYRCRGNPENGEFETTFICQDPPTCHAYKGNHVGDSETTCVCNDAPTCHHYKCNGVVIGRDQL